MSEAVFVEGLTKTYYAKGDAEDRQRFPADAGPIIREPSGSTGYRLSFLFFSSASFQLSALMHRSMYFCDSASLLPAKKSATYSCYSHRIG